MWSVTLTICETPDGSPALVGYSRCIRMGSLSDSIGVVTDVERIRSFKRPRCAACTKPAQYAVRLNGRNEEPLA